MKSKNTRLQILVQVTLALVLLLSQSAFVLSVPSSRLPAQTEINDWYVHKWNLIMSPYACHESAGGCWANPNYHVKSWLMSKNSVLIDSGWANPALVYWTKYESRRQINFCYVEVQVAGDTRWDRIKTIGGTKDIWHKVSIDLKAYSGKNILVKFYCEPNLGYGTGDRGMAIYNKQILYVQDVKVVPDGSIP